MASNSLRVAENILPENVSQESPRAGNKRKKPTRFSAKHDIALLTEVLAVNPFIGPLRCNKWDAIAERLRPLYFVDGRRCKDRISLILKYFITEDNVNLRRSGTEEEYGQRDQMLQEICRMKKDAEEQDATATLQKTLQRQSEERQGSILIDNSMINCVLSTSPELERSISPQALTSSIHGCSSLPSTSRTPSPMNTSNTVVGHEIPISIASQCHDGALIDTSEEIPQQPIKVTRMRARSIPTITNFLQGRDIENKEFRRQKMALRSQELELERERVKIEKARIEIEKARVENERLRVKMEVSRAEREHEMHKSLMDNQKLLLEFMNIVMKKFG